MHIYVHEKVDHRKANGNSHFLCWIFLSLLIGIGWRFLPSPIFILAIGLLPAAIFCVLKYNFLVVVFFIAFSFFRIHEVFPVLYSLKIPLLLSLAALFSLFWHIGITQKIKLYWSPTLTTASVFFSLALLGVFLASNRPIAIKYFSDIYVKIIIMLFSIAWITRTARHFSITSSIIVASGVLVGVVALFNKINGIGIVEETRVTIGRELGSVLGDPNDLALVLMFPSAFALSLLLTKGLGAYTRFLGGVSTLILFFAIIATQSRGGLLGMLAVFAIFGIKKVKSKTLLCFICLVFAVFLFAFAGISDRKSGGAAETGVDASAQGRLYAWEAAAKMAIDNPLTGVGIDNFYSNYYFYSPHWDGLNHAVHSTWFGVLAETGILGLIVFTAFITMLVKSAKRSVNIIDKYFGNQKTKNAVILIANSQAIFAGLVGTIVSGTFLTHGFTWPIYILAGLVVAMEKFTSNKRNFSSHSPAVS